MIWVNSFGSTQCTLRPNERRTETGLAGRRDTERRGFARKRVEAVPKIGADRNRHSRAPARLPGKAAVECDNVLYEMHAVSCAMASSAKPPSKQPAQLTPQQMIAGIERLKKRLEEVERFDPLSVTDQHNAPNLDALEAAVDETLVRTFGGDTLDYDRYKYAKEFDRGPYNMSYQVPPQKFQASIARSKASSVALLGQAIKALEESSSRRMPAHRRKL